MTLYSVNTKEKLTTTYMVNGRHVPGELKKINYLQRRAHVPLLVSSDLEPSLMRLEAAIFPHYLLETGGATSFPTAMAIAATGRDQDAFDVRGDEGMGAERLHHPLQPPPGTRLLEPRAASTAPPPSTRSTSCSMISIPLCDEAVTPTRRPLRSRSTMILAP